MSSPEPTLELKRAIGPRMLLLFIVGDILGTGIYALVGTVVAQVGGLAWLPFALAFVIAAITALSYVELATRFPQAAGAALYVHHAFDRHLLTFLVGFAVLCGSVTAAAAGCMAFTVFLRDGLGLEPGGPQLILSCTFLLALTAVNLLGIGQSLAVNVVLTCVEIGGLLLIIGAGAIAWAAGRGSWDNMLVFESAGGRNLMVALTIATSLAFFAMIGFEDAVNLVEESHDPLRHFPRMMLGAVGLTGVIYTLVAAVAVSLVPIGSLADPTRSGDLTQVMAAAVPGWPVDRVFALVGVCAVANTALLNLVAASRLLYGMARQGVVPALLGRIHPQRQTPWVAAIAVSAMVGSLLVVVVPQHREAALALLGGTASLLVLGVFTLVNVALIVLRRREHDVEHFHAPAMTPWLGAGLCLLLVGPWARSAAEYGVAGYLLLVGLGLWIVQRAGHTLGRPRAADRAKTEGRKVP